MQPDHAVIVPPGGGVRFGNVEFLGLSEHSPRLNVSVITMAPGRAGARAQRARARGLRPAAHGRLSVSVHRRGLAAGVSAYLLWGLFPLYWPLLEPAAPVEILAHRIAWSLVFIAALLAVTSGFGWLRGL